MSTRHVTTDDQRRTRMREVCYPFEWSVVEIFEKEQLPIVVAVVCRQHTTPIYELVRHPLSRVRQEPHGEDRHESFLTGEHQSRRREHMVVNQRIEAFRGTFVPRRDRDVASRRRLLADKASQRRVLSSSCFWHPPFFVHLCPFLPCPPTASSSCFLVLLMIKSNLIIF